MGRKGKEITLEQKSSILALLNSGTSKAEISRLLSLNPSTVYKFCKRFSVRQCKENKPRSGRPSVVSGRGNTLLSRIAKSNRRKSLDDITLIFNEMCPKGVRGLCLEGQCRENNMSWASLVGGELLKH